MVLLIAILIVRRSLSAYHSCRCIVTTVVVPSLSSSLKCFSFYFRPQVKELGTHILVCAVSYVGPTGENLYFRKFFKFQVLKPLDVKTKFYNADSDDVYLEAQVSRIVYAYNKCGRSPECAWEQMRSKLSHFIRFKTRPSSRSLWRK